jgi:TolB-like protein
VQEERSPAAAAVAATPMEAPRSALTLPDKPSIAVLPFNNLSSDPEQEYLADGIVQDIITELSRFSELFVIARNSSFQYKGKAVDVRQVGRELGVHYVLEGSIRRGGNRIRIATQLIDAATGAHRWAEHSRPPQYISHQGSWAAPTDTSIRSTTLRIPSAAPSLISAVTPARRKVSALIITDPSGYCRP